MLATIPKPKGDDMKFYETLNGNTLVELLEDADCKI